MVPSRPPSRRASRDPQGWAGRNPRTSAKSTRKRGTTIDEQDHEQPVGQHQDHQRIAQRQADRPPRLEVGPHEAGQALQGRDSRPGPQPRLDHRAVDPRQPRPLRPRGPRASSPPAHPLGQHRHRRRPAGPEIAPDVAQAPLQRQARPDQRGDLVVEARSDDRASACRRGTHSPSARSPELFDIVGIPAARLPLTIVKGISPQLSEEVKGREETMPESRAEAGVSGRS